MRFMNKKRVIVFSDWFIPGYKAGGPIKSLKNLISSVNCDFHVFTRITDYHSSSPYEGIGEGTDIKISDNCTVRYMKDSRMNVRSVLKILRKNNFDWIYLNSLFSARFTILPLVVSFFCGLNNRVIVAPRGMLKPGALTIKAGKKSLFLKYGRFLYRKVTWHATNEQEAKEILQKFPNAKIVIAPVIPSADVPFDRPTPKRVGALRAVTFSRVSAEKGILEAIQIINAIDASKDVTLDIYGAIPQDDYTEQCIIEAKKGNRVRLMGEVLPSKLKELYANYEVFFLPTWGENYGHAISEALLSAKPVIISDKTPWRNLKEVKAGFDVKLSQEDFITAINFMCDLDEGEYIQWSEGARMYAHHILRNPEVIRANERLFE